MCFTPLASIITAIIEFAIASYLFYRIKDKRLYPLAIFVLFLGLYQFTEFMLCKSVNAIIWGRIGFATYTFLPILIYHFFINASGNKIKKYLYAIPFFFASLSLFYPNFISYTSCNTFHVTVENLVFNQNLILMSFYLLYYLCCPAYGIYIFSKKMKYTNEKLSAKLGVLSAPFIVLIALLYYLWSTIYGDNPIQTWLHMSLIITAGIFVLLLLSLFLFNKSKKIFYQTNFVIFAAIGIIIILLYYVIPNITLNYTSIFCQFALFYGFASVLLIHSLDGLKKKR